MKTPTAFEWHNYETGHCYVDYVPHVDGKSNILDEKNGYTKIPLYSQQPQKEQEEESMNSLKDEIIHYQIWADNFRHEYGEDKSCMQLVNAYFEKVNLKP